MQRKTLQQVIDNAKAGNPIDQDECRDAMLALHSMLTKSRMKMEILAENKDNADAIRAMLGDVHEVRSEREKWMNTIPSVYMDNMNSMLQEMRSFYDQEYKT